MSVSERTFTFFQFLAAAFNHKAIITSLFAGMAVGALFVRKYFDEKSKLDMMAMVQELQNSFREILNETEWIDEATRKLALKKLDSMSLKIGYPDFILNRNKLDEKYAMLQISPDKYFENTLNVLKYLNHEEQSKVGQPVNKTQWATTPAVVNAFYSRSRNQIMFPAGILQAPFFHRYFPKSLNFGGIGVVVVIYRRLIIQFFFLFFRKTFSLTYFLFSRATNRLTASTM